MEIDLQVTDMVVARIITHKMVMAKKEAMTGTVVHEEVVIGMEVEWQLEMKEGIIGAGLVHMTAQAGVLVRPRLTATDCYCWCFCGKSKCRSLVRDLVFIM